MTPEEASVLQQQTFHDTREIVAAEQAGIPTPQGRPLSASSLEILRQLDTAVAALKDWVAYVERQLEQARRVS